MHQNTHGLYEIHMSSLERGSVSQPAWQLACHVLLGKLLQAQETTQWPGGPQPRQSTRGGDPNPHWGGGFAGPAHARVSISLPPASRALAVKGRPRQPALCGVRGPGCPSRLSSPSASPGCRLLTAAASPRPSGRPAPPADANLPPRAAWGSEGCGRPLVGGGGTREGGGAAGGSGSRSFPDSWRLRRRLLLPARARAPRAPPYLQTHKGPGRGRVCSRHGRQEEPDQAEAAAETLLGRGLLGLQRVHLPEQRRGLQVHDVRCEEGHLHPETSTCLSAGCTTGYSAICAPYTIKEREKRQSRKGKK
nr:YY1-associated factor 2 isoform X1 [Chrysemys picta bellii]